MIAEQTYRTTEHSEHLRRFDAARDLLRVADLVEDCFADTLDTDGRNYIRQMRSAANNPFYLRWIGAASERSVGPLSGYIWEEDSQLVGNLTLIPYYPASGRIYLVANVAVDPNYRRRGIARQLTVRAIEHARQNSAQAVWLHVRAENQAAVTLYNSLGFKERYRRNTWIFERDNQLKMDVSSLEFQTGSRYHETRIGPRRAQDWTAEKAWLEGAYPQEISWHLSLGLNILKPGILRELYRLLVDTTIRQWALRIDHALRGVLVLHSTYTHADHLWLATAPEFDNEAAYHLLTHCRENSRSSSALSLDYPAGRADDGIRATGFQLHQTLIWMYLPLR